MKGLMIFIFALSIWYAYTVWMAFYIGKYTICNKKVTAELVEVVKVKKLFRTKYIPVFSYECEDKACDNVMAKTSLGIFERDSYKPNDIHEIYIDKFNPDNCIHKKVSLMIATKFMMLATTNCVLFIGSLLCVPGFAEKLATLFV